MRQHADEIGQHGFGKADKFIAVNATTHHASQGHLIGQYIFRFGVQMLRVLIDDRQVPTLGFSPGQMEKVCRSRAFEKFRATLELSLALVDAPQ